MELKIWTPEEALEFISYSFLVGSSRLDQMIPEIYDIYRQFGCNPQLHTREEVVDRILSTMEAV